MSSSSRSLRGLLVSQFFGAFNDNALKMVVALLGMAAVAGQGELAAQVRTTTAFVALTLPLMLVSLPAMLIADRFSMRGVLIGSKLLEVVLMLLGTAVLYLAPHGMAPMLVLAGMGAQSALYSPAKYGILPQLAGHAGLTRANGQLEAASFLAIILGTATGGMLLAAAGPAPWIAGAVLLVLSVVGFFATLFIEPVPATGRAEPAKAAIVGAWRAVRSDRPLWLATLGTAVFWSIASLLGQDVLVYSKEVLQLSDEYAGLPYATFAIGVGGGSLLAGRIAGARIETGLIPLGAFLLALGAIAMGLFAPARLGTFVMMAWLGLASGLLIVPLNALLQWRAPSERRGGVIALVNFLSFGGILLGNLLCLALAWLGLKSPTILWIAAVPTLVGMVWAVWLLPEALLRLVILLLARTLYRVRVVGSVHVPQQGGALLVSNHVTLLDGLFLLSATDRPVRFLVEQSWYDRWYLRPFLRALRAIPIAASGGPRVLLHALREAGHALDAGELVCLFAEGELSRMGGLLPFRRGLTRIMKGRTAPIVPAHLDRVYGTLFSVGAGRVRWLPTKLPCPVTVSFAPGLSSATAPEVVRAEVEQLAEAAGRLRAAEVRPLHHAVVAQARWRPWASCLVDGDQRRLSRAAALAGAVILARRLRKLANSEPRIGVLLPTSVGGVVATLALSLSGRTSVPLNFTAGPAAIASALRQSGLRTVLTSRAFLERVKLTLPEDLQVVPLEDALAEVGFAERVGALLRALLSPVAWLEHACGATRAVRRDDAAVLVFSSGSTGEPKGVVLSHGNVQGNCDALAQVLPLDRHDGLVAVLPLFHSFGNLLVWYGLGQGARLGLHTNPLDGAAVGELVARQQLTVLLATPTFLQLYMRRCEPAQFGSLRLVIAGAEKLSESLAEAFADRFGLRPLQGYGCTECSPVVSVCTPGFRAPGFYQAGARRGSVGRALPGVLVRILDPETRVPLPAGQAGLVVVRGANVMQGYLGRDDLTAAAMHEGGYLTGDVGRLDEDGFLYLTDRLSRFSKIGGEMVPHGVVEEALQDCSGKVERVVAVCGLPDAKKGERLAVLTTLSDHEIDAALAQLAGKGLPSLFLPKREHFVVVAAIPLLGTGKVDLRGVKELAARGVAGS